MSDSHRYNESYRSDSPTAPNDRENTQTRSRSPLRTTDDQYNDYNNNDTPHQSSIDGSRSPDMDETGKYRRRLMLANVPLKHTETDIRNMFNPYGTIVSIEIPELHINRETGRPSSRWAFLEMSHHSEAKAALEALHETLIDGRKFYVTYAKPKGVKQPHTRGPPNQRYGGGGYNQYNRYSNGYNDPYYNDRYSARADPYQHSYRDPYYDRAAPYPPSHYHAQPRAPVRGHYDDPYAAPPHSYIDYNEPSTVPSAPHTTHPSTRVYNQPAVPVESREMQLYISGIGLDITLADALEELSRFGVVVNHRELHSKHHPTAIGSMFVSYESESQADRARTELNGTTALGSKSSRGLIVEWSGRYQHRNLNQTNAPHANAASYDDQYTAHTAPAHDYYQQDTAAYAEPTYPTYNRAPPSNQYATQAPYNGYRRR